MNPTKNSIPTNTAESVAKPVEVKIHRKPKTERKYERVQHVIDLIRVIEKHGDRVGFSYFDSKRKLVNLTYA